LIPHPNTLSHGGLKEGMVVELANGSMALVMSCGEEEVVLDANNMMAGKTLSFEVQLLSVERT
jgi:FKBP-type peptidyl-prolyl cis-trans isomerase 2